MENNRIINAENMPFDVLNEQIRTAESGTLEIENCLGHRYIGCGTKDKKILVRGISGNALGAYLNGGEIVTYGNAQDAVGDTMNAGKIVVHGDVGDTVGYAMRGGEIYVKGDAGYRAGIHMKAYKEKLPVIVIGGKAGSFLGEYQAGGVIVILNTDNAEKPVGYFPCTGMHGGKVFLRSDCANITFPAQVHAKKATDEDMAEIDGYIKEYCVLFGANEQELKKAEFTVVTPDSKNPYKQMYVGN